MGGDGGMVACAPMVLGSELAFRMLVRRHGVTHTYSPMVKADRLVGGASEEQRILEDTSSEDRPLALQLCGRDPAVLAKAVRHALDSRGHCLDAIDFNLGCPQRCAEQGGWGSYLEREPELAAACVAAMAEAAAPTPVWCKIRIGASSAATLAFALRLQEAGCSLLAVHCRPRPTDRDEFHDTEPDYSQLADLVRGLRIPVVANGGICTVEQAAAIVESTGVRGVMAATPLLRNPRAFRPEPEPEPEPEPKPEPEPVPELSGRIGGAIDMAREYLDLAAAHPPPSPLFISKHLRWLLREFLQPAHTAAVEAAKALRQQRGSKAERRRRSAEAGPDSQGSAREDEADEESDSWSDWRVQVWHFLARPYLTEQWQFVAVVDVIEANACPARWAGRPAPPSLREIRLGERREHEEEEAQDEAQDGAEIGSLFGWED